jgi:hypothetical protein
MLFAVVQLVLVMLLVNPEHSTENKMIRRRNNMTNVSNSDRGNGSGSYSANVTVLMTDQHAVATTTTTTLPLYTYTGIASTTNNLTDHSNTTVMYTTTSTSAISITTISQPILTNSVTRDILNSTEYVNLSALHSYNDNSTILVVVPTTFGNIERRNAMRATWLSTAFRNAYRVSYFFLLGRPNSSVSDSQWGSVSDSQWEALQNESAVYHDIIVLAAFVDSYENLTYKMIGMLALAHSRQLNTSLRYLIKADDDTIVNIPKMRGAIGQCEQRHSDTFLPITYLQRFILGSTTRKSHSS